VHSTVLGGLLKTDIEGLVRRQKPEYDYRRQGLLLHDPGNLSVSGLVTPAPVPSGPGG
jgi:hypothetical protein